MHEGSEDDCYRACLQSVSPPPTHAPPHHQTNATSAGTISNALLSMKLQLSTLRQHHSINDTIAHITRCARYIGHTAHTAQLVVIRTNQATELCMEIRRQSAEKQNPSKSHTTQTLCSRCRSSATVTGPAHFAGRPLSSLVDRQGVVDTLGMVDSEVSRMRLHQHHRQCDEQCRCDVSGRSGRGSRGRG